jgi:hypothetical protein
MGYMKIKRKEGNKLRMIFFLNNEKIMKGGEK